MPTTPELQEEHMNEYTVLRQTGFLDVTAESLDGCMRQAQIFYEGNRFPEPPIAWAPERELAYGGTKVWGRLLAESIAAGRLIELVDGKYVARGSMTPTLDKLEASIHPADLAMRMRDLKAGFKPKPAAVIPEPPASTAKPSPFASFRSPDLCATSHQVDPAHQLKG